ncbi:hypothetical protein, partial [Paenibacillus sp. OSY-SE]
SDFMVEAMKIFTRMFHQYEEDKDKDFEQDVLKKRQLYMDRELLKKEMAEKRKSSDTLTLLYELLGRDKMHSVDKILVKEE